MNGLKRLKIEWDGIYGTVEDYTSDSNVMNYLTKMKEGIDDLDYDIVKYSLKELIDWYDRNINEIRSNRYVTNFDSHKKNHALLKEVYEILRPEDFDSNSCNTTCRDTGKNLFS